MENSVSPLATFVRMFEEAEEARQDAAKVSEKCRDYYDGNQLTAEERAALAKRKQPQIVVNRVRRKVDWLRGLEMQSRTDPKAYPRTPAHQQGAEAVTDALRFIADDTDFDRKRSQAWENMLVEGIGAIEIVHTIRPGSNEPDVAINHYPHDRIFHDPHSRMHGFEDARYKGVVIWTDAESLVQQYPEKEAEINGSISSGSPLNGSFDDAPSWKIWSDKARKRVRLVLMHYLHDGHWHWVKFVHNGIIDQGVSPYVDEYGQTVCPLLMQSAYIDREGNRYGVVVDMIGPQDEINKRRSKLLHSLNTRQTMGLKGVVDTVKMKGELSKPDGHVELDPDLVQAAAERGQRAFEILQVSDQTSGQFSLLQEAKNEIDLMGANSGLAGKDGVGQSGRAIMARQQGGLIEIAPLTDGLSDFTRRCYRHMWMRIRQFWKAEKWIRVTDDDRNIRFVGFNTPITLQDQFAQMPPEGAQQMAYDMGIVPGDPRLSMPVGAENSIDEIDVDILIEEVPDTVTLESETFQQIMQLATSQPGVVPPDMLVEMAPGLKRDIKDKLIERIQSQMQPEQDPMQEQAAQMQMARADVEIKGMQARAQKDMSLATKTNVEAQRLALGF